MLRFLKINYVCDIFLAVLMHYIFVSSIQDINTNHKKNSPTLNNITYNACIIYMYVTALSELSQQKINFLRMLFYKCFIFETNRFRFLFFYAIWTQNKFYVSNLVFLKKFFSLKKIGVKNTCLKRIGLYTFHKNFVVGKWQLPRIELENVWG